MIISHKLSDCDYTRTILINSYLTMPGKCRKIVKVGTDFHSSWHFVSILKSDIRTEEESCIAAVYKVVQWPAWLGIPGTVQYRQYNPSRPLLSHLCPSFKIFNIPPHFTYFIKPHNIFLYSDNLLPCEYHLCWDRIRCKQKGRHRPGQIRLILFHLENIPHKIYFNKRRSKDI